MPVEIKNTRDLVDPDTLKLKVLIIGPPGTGKTTWASSAPNPGFAACETGHGHGLQSIADKGLDYAVIRTKTEYDEVCAGRVFADKDTIVLDSLSEMSKTFIKDAALAIPRSQGNSPKRQKGIPELDDYGTMAELTRRSLRQLIELDKHVIATATMRIKQPDAVTGQGAFIIGPDLPGQMFEGSVAMFDMVLFLRTRQKRRDPKDNSSRYTERYLITQPDNVHLAKCRYTKHGRALLAKEIIFNVETGEGSFQEILRTIVEGYKA